MARLWVEAGAKGRGGLALPPLRTETWAGCFPLLNSHPYSSTPLHELLASMLSCSEEFTPHLRSKQKKKKRVFSFYNFFFFF